LDILHAHVGSRIEFLQVGVHGVGHTLSASATTPFFRAFALALDALALALTSASFFSASLALVALAWAWATTCKGRMVSAGLYTWEREGLLRYARWRGSGARTHRIGELMHLHLHPSIHLLCSFLFSLSISAYRPLFFSRPSALSLSLSAYFSLPRYLNAVSSISKAPPLPKA
jgi:hypothetical protein